MCKYCQIKGNSEIHYIFNSPIVALKIKDNKINGLEIISYNHKKEIVHNYKIINYCPMCGRNLGGLNNE